MHQLITDFLSMSIDWVSLHSTGTLIFDPLEVSTVKSAFGEHLPWLSAFKRTIGHTLSAAGVFDALLLSKGLEAGEWPIWPKNMDHLLNLPSNRNVPSTQPNTALQLGQGMGGLVTCNLWRRL
jgi:3-oxoacyl-(acyl-carrier-protein) synthase